MNTRPLPVKGDDVPRDSCLQGCSSSHCRFQMPPSIHASLMCVSQGERQCFHPVMSG